MKSTKTTDFLFTKFKTKVLNLSLNLDLSPFVKSTPVIKRYSVYTTNKLLVHNIHFPLCNTYARCNTINDQALSNAKTSLNRYIALRLQGNNNRSFNKMFCFQYYNKEILNYFAFRTAYYLCNTRDRSIGLAHLQYFSTLTNSKNGGK